MSSLVKKLVKAGLITPPQFLPDNIHYETIIGSEAYGINKPGSSDKDIMGFCVPEKEILFPWLTGEIFGFDMKLKRFEQYMQHHINLDEQHQYDVTIYNIVKFFRLAADGSPAVVESLFTPINCVISSTPLGELVRQNRSLFLSKKLWHTLRGYSFSQISKALNRKYEQASESRRLDVEKYGYSTKDAAHCIRLMLEAEQLLLYGDLDLQKDKELLKSIRRGEWQIKDVQNFFGEKEKQLEKLYVESKAIPDRIRETEIKQLLLNCLEHHYGSLDECIVNPDKYKDLVNKIHMLIHEAK
jgi:uncharacterized protein